MVEGKVQSNINKRTQVRFPPKQWFLRAEIKSKRQTCLMIQRGQNIQRFKPLKGLLGAPSLHWRWPK